MEWQLWVRSRLYVESMRELAAPMTLRRISKLICFAGTVEKSRQPRPFDAPHVEGYSIVIKTVSGLTGSSTNMNAKTLAN
mmetsp:Transcript_7009/g.30799  ORF Transcript_7009/g.30799 Transcript_7009/m.30799 type:complete len:80 (-) Transcript_7009:5298-5537(-)